MCYYGNMSDKLIIVNKKTGQTPLDCINEIKASRPDLADLPMTYAGRLDPLASGVLLVLVGDECLKKNEYLDLTKEYEVDILLGFSTDTYDVMGRITQALYKDVHIDSSTFSDFVGTFSQPYPPYSSRTVEGKPLFKWAREDRLEDIEIPSRDVYVDNIKIVREYKIKGSDLLSEIHRVVGLVSGDFRQEEVLSIWDKSMNYKKDLDFKIIRIKIVCDSGVYVRSIAHNIGEKLGIPALAFNIVRTKVGDYSV